MNLLEAAQSLLRQAGVPLHVRDIAQSAEEQGLIEMANVRSLDLVHEGLLRAIENAGDDSPIVQVGSSVFALREWEEAEEYAPETEPLPARTPDHGTVPSVEPIELEPELELSFERLPPWQSVFDRVQTLVRQRPQTPFYARSQGFLLGLFGWGVLNVLGGLALAFRPKSKFKSGLAATLLSWGSANALTSLVGMERVAEDDAQVASGEVSRKSLDRRMAWYREATEILSTVGALAGIAGLVLGLFSHRDSRTRGRGLGLLTQGSFLATLTAANRFLDQQRATAPESMEGPDA